MSKEQKTLKSCYILDRLREWFELYGNQNHQRAEEELHLAIDELYEYQQKDRQLADLEAKLAESEKQCRECKHLNKKIELNIKNKLMAENCELQKQLADKEQENEHLKKEICKYEITLMDKNSQLKKQHQDKILFAVEQLLDIKEEVFGTREMGIVFDIPPVQDAFNIIENKIKQLKREE